jgi:hypothetical protein
MIRLMFSLMLASAIAATAAVARSPHYASKTYSPETYSRCNASAAGPYTGYNPCNDPNAVFSGGTYAGSDPDPNIQGALIREFGRQKFSFGCRQVIGGLRNASRCARFDLSGFSAPPY